MQDGRQVWEDNLDEEIQHWRGWLGSDDEIIRKNREWKLDPRRKIPACFDGLTRLVDVGCGPLPRLGLFNNDGSPIDVIAIDPLARAYNRLIDEFGLVVNPRPIECPAESVTKLLARNSMDGAFCHNALDHSFHPWLGFLEMIRVVRVGGVVNLVVCVNEGERMEYGGLHQWNFCPDEREHVILWREGFRLDLVDELQGVAEFGGLQVQENDMGVSVMSVVARKLTDVERDHWPSAGDAS